MTHIHQAASTGFKNALAYDAHRPSYPTDAVQGLLTQLSLANHAGARIVDLAAGTGKLTEVLAARDEKFQLVAVEPLEEMRQTLEAKALAGVKVEEGTAAKMEGVEDAWADAVVVAQAFHWFANEEALGEIRRVLRPGGKLALIWNVEDYNKPAAWAAGNAWGQAINELIFSLPSGGQTRFRDDTWREVFGGQSLFSTPLAEEKTDWAIWLSPEALWDRVNTLSQVAILEGEERTAFQAKFDGIVKGGDADWNEKGEVNVHAVTFYTWTTRL